MITMRATIKPLLSAATIAACLTSRTDEAKADAYDQAASVITKLIEHELATSVIPNAAAKVPQACKFFPGSLRALQQSRFSAVPQIAKHEGADAIGYFVWQRALTISAPTIAATAKKDLAIEQTLTTPVGDAPPPREEVPDADKSTMGVVPIDTDKIKHKEGGAAKATVCEHVEESEATVELRKCREVQQDVGQDLACAVGLLARDAIAGDKDAMKLDAERFALRFLEAAVVPKLDKVLQQLPGDIKTRLLAYAGVATDDALRDAIVKAVAPVAADIIHGRRAWNDIPIADILEKIRAPKAAGAAPSTAAEEIELRLVVNKSLAEPLRDAIDKIAALVESPGDLDVIVKQATSLCNPTPTTNVAKRACDVINSALGESKALVFSGLIKAISRRDYGLAIGIGIDATLGTQCTWLNPCNDREVRQKRLADVRLKAAQANKPLTETVDEQYTDEVSRELISRITVVLVDAQLSGKETDASDVVGGLVSELVDSSKGPIGIRRKAASWAILLPAVAARYGWAPGDYDASGVSQPHVFFTAQALNLHGPLYYTKNVYVGMQVSAIDLLAPLYHVSTRPKNVDDTVATIGTATAWSLLTPRVDFVAGVPSFSDRLLVGVGFGLRTSRLASQRDAVTGAESFKYCLLGAKCADGRSRVFNFGEASAFVKLLF